MTSPMLSLDKTFEGLRMPSPEGSQAIMSQERRDVLGHVFFWHHLIVVAYIALGWLVPVHAALVFYLVLLPAVALQWQINRDSCVLNNLESLIRSGRWRDPANREEGAFLLEIARRHISPDITSAQMNAGIYTVMAVFWGLGLGHFLRLLNP